MAQTIELVGERLDGERLQVLDKDSPYVSIPLLCRGGPFELVYRRRQETNKFDFDCLRRV